MNQAFVFLKPHAVHNKKIRSYVDEVFAEHRISVDFDRVMTGRQIAESGIVDSHYAVNARVGLCAEPRLLELDTEARENFSRAFGASWDDEVRAGRIVSGMAMLERLGVDGETLNTIWARQSAHKLAGGLYVGYFPERDCYVMNGFYPSLREILTADDAIVFLMVVSFDPATLSWRKFRREIIGATNPAAAEDQSVRGWCFANQDELGVKVVYRENVIHASASAFEAFIEKYIWLGDWALRNDPLWKLIGGAGISPGMLIDWRDRNPVVKIDGREGPLVDLLEDRDTPETAGFLSEAQCRLLNSR